MPDQDQYIQALIRLHTGLARQGPGDQDIARSILSQLTQLPAHPRIADLGSGAGSAALLLAETLRAKVKAVDFSSMFLAQMMEQADQQGLQDQIEPIEADMGTLDWPPGSIDLLWSEGAAYTIGFAHALKVWRPLLAMNGYAVISEMNLFSNDTPVPAAEYLASVYPDVQTESRNIDTNGSSGYRLLESRRLPSASWWQSYYDPLQKKLGAYQHEDDVTMQMVIEDTKQEMAMFKQYGEFYGYTFFIMQAA